MDNKIKTGLFFGSYNPIHNGHVTIAEHILTHSDLDEIWFVVSPLNPWKKGKKMPSSQVRKEMVELAVSGKSSMHVTNFEEKLPKPSYTYASLSYLKKQHPDNKFILIIGGDNLALFHKWRHYQEIIENYEVWAYPRGEMTDRAKYHRIKIVDAPLLEVSSSMIRERIQNGEEVNHLIPENVCEYIVNHKLYTT